MKLFIAYTLLVVGIPIFIGLILGSIISIPLIRAVPSSNKLKIQPYFEVFNGLGAILTSALIFRILDLHMSIAVLAIMAAWTTFYFFAYKQQVQALFSTWVGMIGGWFIIPVIGWLNQVSN